MKGGSFSPVFAKKRSGVCRSAGVLRQICISRYRVQREALCQGGFNQICHKTKKDGDWSF